MSKWNRLVALCVGLSCVACEVPESWKHASKNETDASPPRGAAPTRNQCGSGDASCDVPLGRYSIQYTFLSGTCDDESGETGVRFSDDSEEVDLFPFKDHEISMTADNALFLDRECSSLDPPTPLASLEGLGAPCTARYSLLGTRE